MIVSLSVANSKIPRSHYQEWQIWVWLVVEEGSVELRLLQILSPSLSASEISDLGRASFACLAYAKHCHRRRRGEWDHGVDEDDLRDDGRKTLKDL